MRRLTLFLSTQSLPVTLQFITSFTSRVILSHLFLISGQYSLSYPTLSRIIISPCFPYPMSAFTSFNIISAQMVSDGAQTQLSTDLTQFITWCKISLLIVPSFYPPILEIPSPQGNTMQASHLPHINNPWFPKYSLPSLKP